MPASRSPQVPRGTLRALRREALILRHVSDAEVRTRMLARGAPPWMVDAALERRHEVLASGFLRREPDAALFELRAHAEEWTVVEMPEASA